MTIFSNSFGICIFLSTFFHVNTTTGSFENYVLGQPINQTDPCLLETFKKKMLLSPRPFSELFNKSSMEKPSDNSDIEKLKWVEKLLIEGSPKGAQFFFVETNAQEGDYSSVTSRLETFGWNGVLIEPRRWTFQTLVKNRKAWAVNTALCLTPNTEIEDLLFEDRIIANTSKSVVQNQTDGQQNKTIILSCIPFYTILKALNGSVVDFLNLNVDGAEFQVLKTIPFDHVIFNVMSVKCIRIPGEKPIGQLMDLLESKQYKLVKTIDGTNECLFVYKPLYEEKQSIIDSFVKS